MPLSTMRVVMHCLQPALPFAQVLSSVRERSSLQPPQ
jgi:hypothetical protein